MSKYIPYKRLPPRCNMPIVALSFNNLKIDVVYLPLEETHAIVPYVYKVNEKTGAIVPYVYKVNEKTGAVVPYVEHRLIYCPAVNFILISSGLCG